MLWGLTLFKYFKSFVIFSQLDPLPDVVGAHMSLSLIRRNEFFTEYVYLNDKNLSLHNMLHSVGDNVINSSSIRESYPSKVIKTTLVRGDQEVIRCYEWDQWYNDSFYFYEMVNCYNDLDMSIVYDGMTLEIINYNPWIKNCITTFSLLNTETPVELREVETPTKG